MKHYNKNGILFLTNQFMNEFNEKAKGSTSAKVAPLKRNPLAPTKKHKGDTLGKYNQVWP